MRKPASPDSTSVVRARCDLPPGARVSDALVGTTIAVSPKGELIAFTSITVNGFRMYVRHINELTAREVGGTNVAGRNLTFSPDMRTLVYRTAPGLQSPRDLLSVPYGAEPLWGRDGRSCFYRGPNGEVVTGSTFAIGARTTLFEGDYVLDSTHSSWDVAPDSSAVRSAVRKYC